VLTRRRRDDRWWLGSHERGWDAVGARYRGGEVRIEIIAEGVSGDLGYTFHVEPQVARLAGSEKLVPIVLRVTHIYRREEGAWKLLHRHADPLTTTQPVEAVVQR
jgi:ketosteroid isomerase-like protein